MGIFEIRDSVNTWLQQQKRIAVATVIQTWGSSPRRAGAKLAVTTTHDISGSVSGGCVEAEVITTALDGLDDGHMRLLHFSVSDDTAWDVGLACGGDLTVLTSPLDTAYWQALDALHGQRRVSLLLVADQTPPHQVLFAADGHIAYQTANFPADVVPEGRAAALQALRNRSPQRLQVAGHDAFVDPHLPAPRLVVIGGAHVAVALQHLAAALGFVLVLIDPRKAFATDARFPHIKAIHHAYPDVALPQIALDADSYVVILSHDPKIDDPAIIYALQSDVPYIGVMSSRRTHTTRLARLREKGVADSDLARLRVPIGINIGAKTPEEIALSILAEIVAARNDAL